MSIYVREAVSRFFGRYGSALKRIWAIALTVFLVYASHAFFYENKISWKLLLAQKRVVSVTALESAGLICILLLFLHFVQKYETRGILKKRLFGEGIAFTPFRYPSLRFFFLPAFYFNLPLFALIEEMIFRDGLGVYPTANWFDAVLRSLVFGLIHCTGGASIFRGLILSIPGLWFSKQYFSGGLELAVVSHFIYNIIAVTFYLLKWCWTKKYPFD